MSVIRATTALVLMIFACSLRGVESPSPAFDGALVQALAKQVWPDASGAMGRNRQAWFHARFQMGAHRLADHAIVARSTESADAFVRAVAIAFAHQEADGSFTLVIPPALAGQQPGATDLASGTAFFLASAGSGWLTLERSPWFQDDPACAALRQRLTELRPALARSASHLLTLVPLLRRGDEKAPNRLLFDALACRTLGTLLADQRLIGESERFRDAALALVDPAGGWFIEGGGFDSSYNAVACAIGQRLRLAGDADPALAKALMRAATWQLSRIKPTGEVDTTGNARVSPDGESFLGRRKDVDVAHVLECLHFAAVIDGQAEALPAARRVFEFYRRAAERR